MTARCGDCQHFDGEPHGGDGIGECHAPRAEGSAYVHRQSRACPAFEPAPATPKEQP